MAYAISSKRPMYSGQSNPLAGLTSAVVDGVEVAVVVGLVVAVEVAVEVGLVVWVDVAVGAQRSPEPPSHIAGQSARRLFTTSVSSLPGPQMYLRSGWQCAGSRRPLQTGQVVVVVCDVVVRVRVVAVVDVVGMHAPHTPGQSSFHAACLHCSSPTITSNPVSLSESLFPW